MEVPNLLSLGKADNQTERGGGGVVGGRAEGKENENLVYGLLTSQYPIIPAWRIDRIKE